MSPTTPRPESTAPRRYWAARIRANGTWRTDPGNGQPMTAPGEDLAALRRGLGHDALTVPAMWPFYITPTDGRLTRELEAEHAALALFGLHQQSQDRPMHKRGQNLGMAMLALRRSDRFSPEAVDRRLAAAANATSVPALVHRLRGLITQLRGIAQPLDYDQLLHDIQDWHHPESRRRVRRVWGLHYDAWRDRTDANPKAS